jgi:hypothetical protein
MKKRRQLLEADAGLAAFDPAPEVTSGILWAGASLPALVVSQISKVPRNILKPGEKRRVSDRVQVTALGQDYPMVKDLLRVVRSALADRIEPEVADATEVVILWDSSGPDFSDEEASIPQQSDDFFVTFNETR